MIVSGRFAIASSLVSAASLGGQTPPTADSLAGITQRGRILAAYDYAAWHATDAVLARRPAQGEIRGYVALLRDGEWVVSFGRMSDDGQAFLAAYDAQRSSSQPDSFEVTHHVPPRRETGDLARR